MKTRVLHVIPSLTSGGIESLVVALYENIDRQRVQFDFAVLTQNNPTHKKHLEELGATIHFIADAGRKSTVLSKVLWRLKASVNFMRLICKNKYDVVHCHSSNNYGLYILIAALCGIPVRIVHSHGTGIANGNQYFEIARRFKNILSFDKLITDRIGCSNAATKWLFGSRSIESHRAKTIYNGIDLEKFSKGVYEKDDVKKQYNIKEGIHFINIGRFCMEKNQSFLIDIFHEMSKKREDVYLNILGYGPLEKSLIGQVGQLGLQDKVKFYKYNTNITQILTAMDYFLFPSLFEGLPIATIEAQAMGIPTFISDTVSKEVDIGLAVYLPINEGAKFWAEEILKKIENESCPRNIDLEREKLFDIRLVARQFEQLYQLNKVF